MILISHLFLPALETSPSSLSPLFFATPFILKLVCRRLASSLSPRNIIQGKDAAWQANTYCLFLLAFFQSLHILVSVTDLILSKTLYSSTDTSRWRIQNSTNLVALSWLNRLPKSCSQIALNLMHPLPGLSYGSCSCRMRSNVSSEISSIR